MKHLVKLLSLGAALAAAPLAHATLISIGLQASGVNSGAITTVTSGNGYASYGGPTSNYGAFTLNSITATGSPFLAQGSLNTTSMQVASSSGGTITIYITASDLTSPSGLTTFLSSFTSNTFNGSGVSVVESTLYSSTNALYAGTQLASQTFTTGNQSPDPIATLATLTGTYSETVKYVVTIGTGGGNVNDTVNLTATAAATPEPSSLLMLGTGLVSAAGMLLRKRRIS